MSTQIRRPRLSSRYVCSSTTGAGPTCRFICASGNGFRNRRPKFPFISKKRRRCCSTKICTTVNVLVIRIQPDEGISLRIHAKVPGTSFHIEPVKMDFHYGTSFGKASPEAYERLLLDAMSGDATLFARRDEVEEAWAFIDPIEEAWHAKKDVPELFFYPAGSWGPEAADDLLARDGRAWRRL